MKNKSESIYDFKHIEELFNASNEGLWEMRNTGEVFFFNEGFYTQFNLDLENSTLDEWQKLIHPDDVSDFDHNITAQIENGISHFESQYRVLNKLGRYVIIEARGVAKFNEAGQFEYMVGSHCDITKRQRDEQMIFTLAYKDQLTGLYNRQKLNEMIGSQKEAFRILYMNLSKFRLINDTYGYEAANRVLKLFAEALLAVFDYPNHVFRVDADEFAVILTGNYSSENIERIISHFVVGFKGMLKAFINGLDINLYMGLSDSSEDQISEPNEVLLDQAKWAGLYAKRKELDYCVIYNDNIKKETERSLYIELEMMRGLKNGEFYMMYQPVYKKGGVKIAFYESLMRWSSSEYGLISPDEFIPAAELTRDIIPLGYFAIKSAVDMAKKLHFIMNKPTPIAINLSVIQLLDERFLKRVTGLIDPCGIPRKWFIFEITESFALETNQVAKATLKGLSDAGFQVALDDFGSGYSSLTSLLQIGFDKLKIDKQLIWKASLDEEVETFITALTYLCHSKGIDVVAEGIETSHMSQNCQKMGIDYEQGFLYSKPLEMHDILLLN